MSRIVFGCKTIDSDESTISYFDEETGVQLSPRFEFASQDWRAAETLLLLKSTTPSLTVVPDLWKKCAGLWFLERRGRNSVTVLNDFLECGLPDEIKRKVIEYLNLTGDLVTPHESYERKIVFCNDIRGAWIDRMARIMVEDNTYGLINVSLYAYYYNGTPSYCSRCGEYKKERGNLMREGVCILCAFNGLRFNYEHEINDFTGDPFIITCRANSKSKLRFVLVYGQQVLGMLNVEDSHYHIELPELIHPEWF